MLDIVFVLGSRQPNASGIFRAEKSIAETMIKDQKTADTSYSIIQYGKKAATRAHFDNSRSDEDTTTILKSLRWFEEGTALKDGIKAAGEIHAREGRIHARKVVVVFSSGPVEPSENEIKDVVDPLEEKGVKVISVVFGDSVDPKLNVIKKIVTLQPDEENPSGPVKEEAFKGQCLSTSTNESLSHAGDFGMTWDRYLLSISLYLSLFLDPCFAKECSQSERCRVNSGDKTTCSKFDISV